MSDSDWEEMVQEWATAGLKPLHGYSQVHRCGGAGDKGRDVIAYVGDTTGIYDNFQCKHYDHALHPGDVWLEIGKLCYYTFIGEYSVPRKYKFVAPLGVGTTLLRLLEKPDELKAAFLTEWDSKCSSTIVGKKTIALTPELRAHIDALDFSMFGALPHAQLVEEHSRTPFHVARFGAGLPPRIDDDGPPSQVGENEARYVRQLLNVYGEAAGCALSCVEELTAVGSSFSSHLQTSREEFFSAECLNKFSRDYLPPGSFSVLQQDIHDGVLEVLDESHANALARVRATTKQAKLLPIEGHPLRDVVRPRDKAGICHQLANEDRITWIENS
jgi:hypothetical protein